MNTTNDLRDRLDRYVCAALSGDLAHPVLHESADELVKRAHQLMLATDAKLREMAEQREREGWQRVSQQIDDEILSVEIDRLRELNDELVGALANLLDDLARPPEARRRIETVTAALAALAKAKGDSHE